MATQKEAAELKQQGAIEAASNPESSVTVVDAEKKIVEESRNAGIPAFRFDPDATPEQKRAQARAAVPDGLHHRNHGFTVVTDADDDGAPVSDLPPPSKEGVIDVVKDENGKTVEDQGGDDGFKPYSRAGWAPQFGWPKDVLSESQSLLDHSTWVESKIPDKFFGDWYHNAAIIVFACLTSWLVALFGGGLGWVLIIMAACSTYYRTSIRRVRRNFRDDITREMGLKKLENETESLEWINSFLVKFWPIYQPVLAETIVNSVDQVLSSATPAFLDSLKLTTFTLGSKPPRMEHVKTHMKTEDDVVIMDWKFSFTPNDTADMTSRQVKNKINPKVVLEIRIGKAMISKGLDVIVEDMAFSGLMRLKVKLQLPFPHVEKIEMCFLERPTIDYVCKPLGGETFGFDINFIPGLESFILEQIHGNLAPMMYAPNVFPIEVAKMLAGTPVDQAVGVVAVTLHGAQGLKNTDNFAGSVDPYAVLTLNRRQPLARTKHIKDTSDPRWNETHYIIVTSFTDSLDIQVFDFNDIRKHKELGVGSFALERLEEEYVHEGERLEVLSDGKSRGVISCDIRFFPVLESKKLPDGTEEPAPESNQGILRFTVEQAKELDSTKSLVGLLNPYAILHLNGKDVHTTKKLKRTNNPIWDNGSKEMLITDRKSAKLGVTVKDERDLTGDQVLGQYQIKLDDLIECIEQGKDWFHLAGAQTGRVKLRAQWRPVAIEGIMAGTGGYLTPVGVMRFHFQKATDLRNFEAMGKSDAYARVLLSGLEKGRTVTFKNDLNPEWNEVIYVPVHSPRERITIDVMDEEKMGKDRSLGIIEVPTSTYMVQDENGEYLPHDEKKLQVRGLRLHGKGMEKGLLHYTVSFFPCLNIADPDDEEEEEGESTEKKDEKKEEKAAEAAPAQEKTVESTTTNGTTSNGSLDSKNSEPATPKTPVTPMTPSTVGRKSKEAAGPPKIRLTPQELLKHESGLVIFKLLDAELPRSNIRLEVYVDDMAFPSYVSSHAKSRTYEFNEIGDCFIRELDFSRLTLRLREKGDKSNDGEKESTLAKLTGNTVDTLKQCLNNPTTLKLRDEEGRVSSVKVSLKYLPVRMQLDPSESINNMGSLRVDVLDAQDLPAADSNGKSDPYCKFELGGQEVFKTKTQKKTLSPVWNEFFEVSVPSRIGAKFQLSCYDWDFANSPDWLGGGNIPLDNLEPFRPTEVRIPLDGKSGTVRLRLLFRPAYVTRTRQGTSTFGGAPTRIVTGVAGAPIKAVGVVGHGVGKGTSFIRRGFRSKKDEDSSIAEVPVIVTNGGDAPGAEMGLRRSTGLTEPDAGNRPTTSGGDASRLGGHTRTKSIGASSVHSTIGGGALAGTASFTVISASGFPASSDVYVVVSQTLPKEKVVGKTKHKESSDGVVKFDETFKFRCTPDATFQIQVKEHHTFSSDGDLGEALYFVDETNTGQEKEVAIKSGTVRIKSTFTPPAENLVADSPKSQLRRSFLSKRDAKQSSRESTPNP